MLPFNNQYQKYCSYERIIRAVVSSICHRWWIIDIWALVFYKVKIPSELVTMQKKKNNKIMALMCSCRDLHETRRKWIWKCFGLRHWNEVLWKPLMNVNVIQGFEICKLLFFLYFFYVIFFLFTSFLVSFSILFSL